MSFDTVENLHCLKRAEHILMVYWMCGVLLKDRKLCEDLYFGYSQLAEVVRECRRLGVGVKNVKVAGVKW